MTVVDKTALHVRLGPKPEPLREGLSRLCSIVLLGGSLRSSDLTAGVKRSLLDLPLEPGLSILAHWCNQAEALRQAADLSELPVRVLLTQASPIPATGRIHYASKLSLETDPFEFRGTGGVLRDITRDYAEDAYVLVANGAQVLLDPLVEIARAAAQTQSDVCLVAHQNGAPSGLMLVRCGCLADLPDVGFCDMKEQALPRLTSRFQVTVLTRRAPTGVSVRTASDYIDALRQLAHRREGVAGAAGAFAETWQRMFGLIDEGASVDATAHLHDSVVLSGATVAAGAVVVRSVVCAGGHVRRDAMVVDQVIAPRS